MTNPLIGICFYLEKERYASRSWTAVPRAGDEVMLGGRESDTCDKHGKAAYIVKRVVWGVEPPDDPYSRQEVSIEIYPAIS